MVPEGAGDVVGDVEEHGEPDEGLQVEGGGLVAEEELRMQVRHVSHSDRYCNLCTVDH